jgi:SAM-dependent methyltransferase
MLEFHLEKSYFIPGAPNMVSDIPASREWDMTDERTRFHSAGASWAERASLGGLRAVLDPSGSRINPFLHGVHLYGAKRALGYFSADSYLIDFGCGNGRFSSYFTSERRAVIGTEITWEMIADAKLRCPTAFCQFLLTDGISIPVSDESITGIWCCAVLRYSLLVEHPCYDQIAAEMFRVLRPGAYVVNCEMYVDVPPQRFTDGFERAGFCTRRVLVLNRYYGKLELCLRNRYIPDSCLSFAAAICAGLRSRFDDPNRTVQGLRDYLFVWQKPARAKSK